MQFLILRKADADTERGMLPSEELLSSMGQYMGQLVDAGVMRAGEGLRQSSEGVRLKLAGGKATITDGPFTETKELIAGFSVYETASREEAVEWVKRWPPVDGNGNVSIEIRESGCPGGCAEVHADPAVSAQGKRFVVLLRSDEALEAEVPVSQEKLDRLDAHNAAEAKKGVLLAADGLRSSARASRVNFSGGKPSVMDGPFTEIKEMIAGYWLIRVPAMADAIEWAKRNPYPTGPDVEVEIRPLWEMDDLDAGFTPELREAEQRIRSQQLEAGMHARLAAEPQAWR